MTTPRYIYDHELDAPKLDQSAPAAFAALPEALKKDALWNVCADFIKRHDVSCAETIYQSDRVIENAYELLELIADIVGYAQVNDE